MHQFGRERARELLESSFAQFQADKAVVGLARQLRKSEDALDGYAEAATCHLGDFMEYAGLRQRLAETEKNLAKSRRADRRAEVIDSLESLRPGDVIEVPAGRFSGMAVVIDPGLSTSSRGADREGPRPYVLTADRHARRLSLADFPTPVASITRVKVPRNFNGRNPQARRDLASTLRNRTHGLTPPPPQKGAGRGQGRGQARSRGPGAAEDRAIEDLRHRLRAHPCHGCPDREDHARWSERWFKLDRDARTLRRRIEQRTNTIARQFDRVCDVLTTLGYLEGEGDASKVTDRGRTLMRIYNEMDLLTAESLRAGLWQGLDASELAAVLSTLVYESRRPDDAVAPRVPGGRVKQVLAEMVSIWADLDDLEREHHLDQLHEPDLGFAWAAWRWAEGDELDDILDTTDLAAGDFVRWVKQLLDLADQVADASGDSEMRKVAREAAGRLRRGVVAYSSVST